MAGVSTPQLAAAVSAAGGLGSIGIGATDADGGRAMVTQLRALTDRAFNVNVFVHRNPIANPQRESAWVQSLAPLFAEFGAEPPESLRSIYNSFADDADVLQVLLDLAPPVVSFHFGLPAAEVLQALRAKGIYLLSTVTSLAEAQASAEAGIDAVVAQGIEAGGHRGVFDPDAPDDALGTVALTRLLVRTGALPVIAAGAVMDGAGIAAMLDLGATAVQMGTAFIACPESAADDGYRAALAGQAAYHTTLTTLISGRPARVLANRFSAMASRLAYCRPPDYPIAYDLGKALNTAAKARGEHGFGAQWAGQGAPLSRPMPAAQLMATLARELAAARTAGED